MTVKRNRLTAKQPVQVWEREVEYFRVIWRSPSGEYRRSTTCHTLKEALVRSNRHPWPWAIVREWNGTELVERSK